MVLRRFDVTLPEREIDAIVARVQQHLGDTPRPEQRSTTAWTEVTRLPAMLADTVAGDGPLVFRNVRAFVSGTVVERATVEVDRSRIVLVTPNAQEHTTGATVIDGKGMVHPFHRPLGMRSSPDARQV